MTNVALLRAGKWVAGLVLLTTVQPGGLAQASPESKAEISRPKSDISQSVGYLDLKFEKTGAVQGIPPSQAIAYPVQCSADQAAIEILTPPTFRSFALYSVKKDGARELPLSSVPNLVNPTITDFAVGSSRVGVLVDAEKKNTDSSVEYRQYLVEFGSDGVVKSTVALPEGGRFIRFGILASGDLIALEFDPANHVARLRLRSEDGDMKSEIAVPSDVADLPVPHSPAKSELPRVDIESLAASDSLGRARFTAFGDRLLLWMPGKNTVTEIGEGGALRTVEVAAPEGFKLDGMMPSTDRWIVRFKRSGLPEVGANLSPESDNAPVYEVSQFDGSMRRKLNFGRRGAWLACEKDGVITTFEVDDQQKQLLAVTADLGR